MNHLIRAKSALVCLAIIGYTQVYAQSIDSSHLLKDVEIKSLRPNYAKSNYLNEVYTANALQFQWSDLYIKNYGVGQLSTFSVRGLGPENVSILWEGIPINSPMNGLVDLNQVPNGLLQSLSYSMDENRLTSGGFLSMQQTNSSENILAISSTAYLSNLFAHKVDGNFKFGKSSLSIVNQFTHGKNDFEYKNAADQRTRIGHNGVSQANSQLFYKYNLGKLDLNAGFWYHYLDRDIPQSAFYPVETQSLIDRNYRSFIGLSHSKWDLKLAYLNESQKYDDQDVFFPTTSNNKVQTVKATFNYKDKLSDRLKLNYILYPSYYLVESNNLSDTSKKIVEAIQQVNLKYSASEQLELEAGLKSQVNTNFSNIALPFVAATLQLNKRLSVGVTADINARNPTANDLYYSFFGNSKLKPESNYQLRNTWKYSNSNAYDKVQLLIEPYFIRSIDKINYVPDSAFRVFNIDRVTSYGVNTNMEWVRKIDRENSFRTIVGFNYIDSKDQNDAKIAYVPNFKTILSLNWVNRNYELLMQNNYTSQRYINTANTNSLKPYMLTNIKATYKMYLSKSQMNWSIGIDNLWNENYQEIQGGFMPLRNYYLNFTTFLR